MLDMSKPKKQKFLKKYTEDWPWRVGSPRTMDTAQFVIQTFLSATVVNIIAEFALNQKGKGSTKINEPDT